MAVTVCIFNANKVRVVTSGGLQHVSTSLATHIQNLIVLIPAVDLITNLSHGNDANRQLILNGDSLLGLLGAMGAHPRHAKLQAKACMALLTLASKVDFSLALATSGAVGAVTSAMFNCATDVDVQFYGLWALTNLVWEVEIRWTDDELTNMECVCNAALAAFPHVSGVVDKASQLKQLFV